LGGDKGKKKFKRIFSKSDRQKSKLDIQKEEIKYKKS